MDFKTILTLITAFLIIASCKTKDHAIYQSRANIEFTSDVKQSSLEQITLSEEDESSTITDARRFSIFYAVDNGDYKYVLFAPTTAQVTGLNASVEDHQFSLSVPLPANKANEFIKVLNSNIDAWNQNISEAKGKFSSYNYVPDYETVSTSDSTALYGMPSFSYNFSKSIDGNSFSITLSDGSILWDTTIKEKEKLIRLRDLFQEAIEKIKS